jgi:hypothetical protein
VFNHDRSWAERFNPCDRSCGRDRTSDNRDDRRLDHALVASALSGGPGGHVVNVSEIAEYRVAGPVSERSRGERYGQSG